MIISTTETLFSQESLDLLRSITCLTKPLRVLDMVHHPLDQFDMLDRLPQSQRGLTVWFTGLSGAGKTTICQEVRKHLIEQALKVEHLDGDLVRQTLTKGLGFSQADREENIRRIGFVAHLLTRNDVIVLVSAISPYRATRQEVRQQIGAFIEVFVQAPLAVCEQRDVKGLYHRARAGEIQQFTGIDAPYEPPLSPELICSTAEETIDKSVAKVMQAILNTLTEQRLISELATLGTEI